MTNNSADSGSEKPAPPPADPEAKAAADEAWLYQYHRANGSLSAYYDMFPRKRPWDWGLSEEEKDAIRGRLKEKPRVRARGGNER